MTNYRMLAALIATSVVFLSAGVNSADAQSKVAVIDVGMVFKNHPSFSQELEQLKARADQFKEETRQLQAQLAQEAQVLRTYKPDSIEFREKETELAKKSAALEVQQQNKLRALMQQEAQLHFNTYAQIKEAVKTFCEQRGVQLVLRHDSAPMNQDQPGTIMQKVNGKIVFHQPTNDITQQVVTIVAQASGDPSGGATGTMTK